MKQLGGKIGPSLLSAAGGLAILLACFAANPGIPNIRNAVLQWAALMTAVLLLYAIGAFIMAQIRRFRSGQDGSYTGLIFILSFVVFLILGITQGFDSENYQDLVWAVQSGFESALAGLVCIAIIYGLFRLAGKTGSALKSGFLAAFFAYLFINGGFISAFQQNEQLRQIFGLISAVPTGAVYGLLLSLAIGAIVSGLEILLKGRHPFNGGNQ